MRDFLAWQAPWLLTLQGIPDGTRATLERAAFRQATRVADLYRLYPSVLDDARLNAARVEAALRSSTTRVVSSGEEGRLPFFVHGN